MATYFKQQGLKKGDVAALMLETSVEYPFFWLGLAKIGVTTALVNTQLRQEPLVHSIKIVDCKAIIVCGELSGALGVVRSDADVGRIPVYQYNAKNDQRGLLLGAFNLREELDQVSVQTQFKDTKMNYSDPLVYVYTSGTTGLPKAGVITNSRFMLATRYATLADIRENDTIYLPLPVFHTLGGLVGVGIAMSMGTDLVLRKKFSASNYWTDCVKYNCSVGFYIGEMCRFMLATPVNPQETKHKLRFIMGNGLRPELWDEVKTRFNVPHIMEIYGSTEGNTNTGS